MPEKTATRTTEGAQGEPGQKSVSVNKKNTTTGAKNQAINKALEGETRLVSAAPEGTRNDTLNKAAVSLGQLVAGGELDHGTVQAGLLSAALSAGLPERKSLKTIESGLKGGAKSPRTVPEPTYTGTGQRDGCDGTKKEPSCLKASIDGACDSGDGCDGISEDKKTFSLPEPPLDSFHPDIKAAFLNIAETKQGPVEVPLWGYSGPSGV